MYRLDGQISVRLRDRLDDTDPAWTPVRGSDCKPAHLAGDGWPVTGRPESPGAGRLDH